jgi:hypothetical protein
MSYVLEDGRELLLLFEQTPPHRLEAAFLCTGREGEGRDSRQIWKRGEAKPL